MVNDNSYERSLGEAPQFPTRVVVNSSATGMSRRGTIITWLLTGFLLLGCVGALALANALPFSGAQRTSQGTGGAASSGPDRVESTPSPGGITAQNAQELPGTVIAAEWDGPPVHLDWEGKRYVTAESTFVGDRTAIPGDRVERTLTVVNAGPGEAVARVTIHPDQDIPASATNTELAEDIRLFWDVEGVSGTETFATLIPRGTVTVAEIAVNQGQQIAVHMGFEMDMDIETSASGGNPSTMLRFDVGVQLTGDTEPPRPGTLTLTGLAGILGALALALALFFLGWVLIARRRSRVCAVCDRDIDRDENWVELRHANGEREIRCEECANGSPTGPEENRD